MNEFQTGSATRVVGSIFSLSIGIKAGRLSVGTTPTEVSTQVPPTPNRNTLTINNISNQTVYVGDNTVTTSTGFPVAAGAVTSFTCDPNNYTPVYLVASGTVEVAVLELI